MNFSDIIKVIFGTKHQRDLKAMRPVINLINEYEPQMKKMSDDELKAQTPKFRQMLANGATLDSILPEAFATVREASVRSLGMRPFDVQLMGAIVLHQGKISEMKTGEGKTLTATLAMYLNALEGKGAHLVTVNDYLAKRDATEMGVLYQWLGLTVGCILTNMDDEDRQEAYQSDITYGTNNEFAFDYLRDNMKFDLANYVQRGHNFCIVDEVDSILIDEARTPLLISGPSEGNVNLYNEVSKIIPNLQNVTHYTLDEKGRTVVLTDEGIVKIQGILKIENIYEIKYIELLHHIHQALRAHTLFKRDVDYVVKDGKVLIVDEFTGRLKEGSRWSDGLHQAVEAKEGVEVKSENQTLASVTFQNYFRLYKKLAGMTGTADTEAEEFRKIYNLDVVVIPTNLPMIRIDAPDLVYKNKAAKYKAIVKLIQELHAKGQPILVGTISIDNSELISKELQKLNIPHEVLNAKQHEREAVIVAQAGRKGAITIATNMAGRGTDIKIDDEVKSLGGLYILGTERHEARRIDNQLRGRSGRQGDPGMSKFFLSLEDDLMRIFGSTKIAAFMDKLGMQEDEPIEHKMITNAIARAQKKVESHNFDIRKHLLDFDNVMNEQRSVIYRIRRDILNDEGNIEFVEEMVDDVSVQLVEALRPERKCALIEWPWNELKNNFNKTFSNQYDINAQECSDKFEGEIANYFSSVSKDLLHEKFRRYDPEQVKVASREILLATFDSHWKDHLLQMDQLKSGINLRAYAQKDPLMEYKHEAFRLYEVMRMAIKTSVVENIFRVELYTADEIEELRRRQQEQLEAQLKAHQEALEKQRRMEEEEERLRNKKPLIRGENKVGRNDMCPCGSGKKFKHCHGV